jgi:hypothetical protein
MPYKVSVIWLHDVPLPFSIRGVRHWSLYLHPTSTPIGSLYEADRDDYVGWYYNHETGVDPRKMRQGVFGGEMVLGEIADDSVERFETLAREMVLPRLGTDENCQDWVKAVVSEVVDEMLLPSIAMKKVDFCYR